MCSCAVPEVRHSIAARVWHEGVEEPKQLRAVCWQSWEIVHARQVEAERKLQRVSSWRKGRKRNLAARVEEAAVHHKMSKCCHSTAELAGMHWLQALPRKGSKVEDRKDRQDCSAATRYKEKVVAAAEAVVADTTKQGEHTQNLSRNLADHNC